MSSYAERWIPASLASPVSQISTTYLESSSARERSRRVRKALTLERKPRVLVVDDEIHIRATLAAILNQEGFEARAVAGGGEAIAKAREWQPDLVLSDVIMPDMDGVTASIRILQFLPNCRIVLLSGHGMVHDLMRGARERGYEFDVLLKPMHPTELIEHLRTLLRHG